MTLQERMAEVFPPPVERGVKARIARVTKKSQPSVNAWFNDPSKVGAISRTDAEKIIAEFGLPYRAAWLAEGTGRKIASHVATNTEPGPDTHGPYPLISHVQAGIWTSIVDTFQRNDAEEWLSSHCDLGPHGYMLRVQGDSMKNPSGEYSFTDGMILHVNPSMEPVPGQFVIVRRQSTLEATFKRYVMLDGEPYLFAINPDWPREKRYLKLMPGDVWCGVVVTASYKRLP